MLFGAVGSIILNVLVPLTWFLWIAPHLLWGPVLKFAIGMASPLIHGLVSLWTRRRLSPLAILAIANISANIVLAQLAVDRWWFIAKTGLAPLMIASFLVLARERLARQFVVYVQAAPADTVAPAGAVHVLVSRAILVLTVHFLANAALNIVVSASLIAADPGSEQFNREYGVFLAKSLYLIGIPCYISFFVVALWAAYRLRRDAGVSLHLVLAEALQIGRGGARDTGEGKLAASDSKSA